MLEKIGIGITTFNRNEQLKDTLRRIKELSPKDVKIVIVDDASKIPVEEATFRFDENQGAPVTKNKCLELLDDCEHIFLFDDDTYPIKKGWERLYIDSGIKHLNYTFKFRFDIVDGLLYFDYPNGCMMYVHRSVLDRVGGVDNGFHKYGYWHKAYSQRIFNAGLTPHPFIDVMSSGKYLYCLDQSGKNKSATQNTSEHRIKNRSYAQATIDSDKFHPYKQSDEIKISYSNPYSTEKNIGKALNEFCESVPDGNWICLQDGDIMYQTPTWGKQIEDVIRKHGNDFGLIGCLTNRLGRKIQVVQSMYHEFDIRKHYAKALELEQDYYAEVEDITDKKYIAGMLMLFPKTVWEQCKFKENNIAFDDQFSIDVKSKGYKLGLMKGLYVFHLYRIWSKARNASLDREHLR